MGEAQEYVERYLPLAGKNVVLGVTGSIAAFKAADLASKLVQSGAQVDVVMTSGASEFVGPTTFEALTHRPVTVGLFESNSDLNIDHVALALRADVMVVAPATANTIAKLAIGLADDPLGATALATSAPLIVAPAMDAHMWANRATAHNVETLKSRGVRFAGPVEGRLASGLVGSGRMVEPAEIVEHVRSALATNGDYSGRAVVVSAGGTREPLDPVRYIGNRSSGKMGYAIAAAARDRGAAVTLVAGPGALPDPVDVDVRKGSNGAGDEGFDHVGCPVCGPPRDGGGGLRLQARVLLRTENQERCRRGARCGVATKPRYHCRGARTAARQDRVRR